MVIQFILKISYLIYEVFHLNNNLLFIYCIFYMYSFIHFRISFQFTKKYSALASFSDLDEGESFIPIQIQNFYQTAAAFSICFHADAFISTLSPFSKATLHRNQNAKLQLDFFYQYKQEITGKEIG